MMPSCIPGRTTHFAIRLPARILFGRGEVANAPALIEGFGRSVLVIHGRDGRYAPELSSGLTSLGCETQGFPCAGEPTLAMLEDALHWTRGFEPQVVVGLGGGAVLDLAKALAALIPQATAPGLHLEGGPAPALPLVADPLPFVAIPTTAGTGSEATRNAVIGLSDGGGRKVSLRSDVMMARVAVVDPDLTDSCPRHVTLASGLDALAQVVEPFVSCRATPFTDALAGPAIAEAMTALIHLMQGEDAGARNTMAWVSLRGGMALANAGLGAVHGLAGVIGGRTGAAHGALCGVLLGPILAINRARSAPGSIAETRIGQSMASLAGALGVGAEDAPAALADFVREAGFPGLRAQGLDPADHAMIAQTAISASSMAGNPVTLSCDDLCAVLEEAG